MLKYRNASHNYWVTIKLLPGKVCPRVVMELPPIGRVSNVIVNHWRDSTLRNVTYIGLCLSDNQMTFELWLNQKNRRVIAKKVIWRFYNCSAKI